MEEPWVNGKAFNNPPVRGVMRRLVGRLSETRLEAQRPPHPPAPPLAAVL